LLLPVTPRHHRASDEGDRLGAHHRIGRVVGAVRITARPGGTAFSLDLSRLWVGGIIFATLLILGFGLRIGRATSEQHTLAISNVASGN
jgi:hypothetical protein